MLKYVVNIRFFIFSHGLMLIVLSLLPISQAVALECEVLYVAKKINKEEKWFGVVKDTEVVSGKLEGKGSTLAICKNNTLSRIKKDGWVVTSSSVKIKPGK